MFSKLNETVMQIKFSVIKKASQCSTVNLSFVHFFQRQSNSRVQSDNPLDING